MIFVVSQSQIQQAYSYGTLKKSQVEEEELFFSSYLGNNNNVQYVVKVRVLD